MTSVFTKPAPLAPLTRARSVDINAIVNAVDDAFTLLPSAEDIAASANLAGQLAAPSGAASLGYLPSGAGAQPTDIQTVLRERISVFRFMSPAQIADVKARTMALDVTAAVNLAIAEQVARNGVLYVPAGTYKIIPATSTTDESGAILLALPLLDKMNIEAETGAIFKIADNVSTDALPKSFRMFASNQFLPNGLRIKNLVLDGNGQNNKISPNRATFSFNRFTQALISLSGTPGGVAAGANNVVLDGCSFINSAGASCIVMAQSNTPGVALGKNWKLPGCTFYNNGLDCDDHSSVFGWATDVTVSDCTFDNPAMHNAVTRVGGLVAYEIHGSRTKFLHNTIRNYNQGLWIGSNLTEPFVNGAKIIGNNARVSMTFSDFYSANLSTGASSESAIADVIQYANTVTITADAVADTLKAGFKIGARKQPTNVRTFGNSVASEDTTKNTLMVLMIVSPGQLAKADQITFDRNTGSGLVAGLVTSFGGDGATAATQNIGRVTFTNNELGTLVASPGGLYLNADVILYGAATGRIESLRVNGLQAASPLSVDAPVGGRATVYGKAKVPIAVTWNGVTAIGNGVATSRIAIDTDAGFAAMALQFVSGSTTTLSGGNIYPSFTGLVPDANGVMHGLISFAGGAAAVLAGRVDNTGPYISVYSNSGSVTNASPAAFVSGSYLTIGGNFPVSSVSI